MTSSCGIISRQDQFFYIYIYKVNGSDLAGVFSNNIYGNNIAFENIMSLILIIEDCMNKNAYPKPMSSYRKLESLNSEEDRDKNFRQASEIIIPKLRIPDEWINREPVRTFQARIIFRTISGWQGDIKCIETGESLLFKSDLEFIKFIIHELKLANADKDEGGNLY